MNAYRNLLPPEFRQRLLISLRLRQWCKIWIATVLVLMAGGLHKYRRTQNLNDRWQVLNRQTTPIVETKRVNVALTQKLAELEENIALIGGVNDAAHHLALIGVISQSAQRTGTTIQVQSCTFQETTPRPMSKPANPQNQQAIANNAVDASTMTVELRGLSLDERTIARFIRTLKNVETFSRVELKTVRGTEISNQRLRTYQIECAL